MGYHIGFFGQFGSSVYLRPELVYTSTTSDYDNDDFKMQKLDLPLLLGTKIIGPLHVFAGPAFQYILDTEYDGITISDIKNDFTVGLNIGAGINLGKVRELICGTNGDLATMRRGLSIPTLFLTQGQRQD